MPNAGGGGAAATPYVAHRNKNATATLVTVCQFLT